MSFSLRRAQSSRFLINPFGDHRALLVSSEPLGLVFDPEAQTRRELVAERLGAEWLRSQRKKLHEKYF